MTHIFQHDLVNRSSFYCFLPVTQWGNRNRSEWRCIKIINNNIWLLLQGIYRPTYHRGMVYIYLKLMSEKTEIDQSVKKITTLSLTWCNYDLDGRGHDLWFPNTTKQVKWYRISRVSQHNTNYSLLTAYVLDMLSFTGK